MKDPNFCPDCGTWFYHDLIFRWSDLRRENGTKNIHCESQMIYVESPDDERVKIISDFTPVACNNREEYKQIMQNRWHKYLNKLEL